MRSRFAVWFAVAALLITLAPPFPQPAAAATFTVQIDDGNRLFAPQDLGNITAGDTITWVNVNGTHDVTSADIPAGATAWASGDLNGSATYSQTFTVVGNYRYFSSIRSNAATANAATQDPGEMVGQFTVVADTVAPNAPTGLTATAAGRSQINLSWTVSTPADATSQQLFRSTTTTKPGTPIQTFADNTTASYADTGLTTATLYYYWLDAVDVADNRSIPATASAITATRTPRVVPQEIVLQPAAAATFTVQIDDNNRLFVPQNLGNITAGDTITWVNVNGTHDVTSANIPAGATAWASGDLNGSATFSRTFTVAGNYRYFSSSRSDAVAANTTPQDSGEMVGQFTVVAADTVAPNPPTGLTATAAGGSQINLAWTVSTPADATSQQLFRSTTTTKPGTPIQTFADNTTASYADTGLTAATQYWYWLDALDAAGNRSTSATANATTASVVAMLQLSITPASIDFGSVSPAAAAAALTAVGATLANVKSSGGWTLAVKSIGTNAIDEAPGDDAVFTSGTNTVPVSRMGWRVNPGPATPGTATYAPLSDVNATIGTAAGGTPAAGVDTYLQYQLQTLYSNPVGLRYRTVLLFTATSP